MFERIIQECHRVLKEGGELIFSAVNPNSIRNYKDLLRVIHVPPNEGGEQMEPGKIYLAEYLLSDREHWIQFTNSHWPLWYIKATLLNNCFTIVDLKPHLPTDGEMPKEYITCLKTMPIHLFFKSVNKTTGPNDTITIQDKTETDPYHPGAIVPYQGK
jgi:SAM-dependent methyltransferase